MSMRRRVDRMSSPSLDGDMMMFSLKVVFLQRSLCSEAAHLLLIYSHCLRSFRLLQGGQPTVAVIRNAWMEFAIQ